MLLRDGWIITALVPSFRNTPSTGFRGLIQLERDDEETQVRCDESGRVAICFTPGTLIATSLGMVRVEDLRPDDKVITRDNGYQRLKWIGRQDLGATDLMLMPHLQPVLIRAGAVGPDVPNRDILVSPGHRILLKSRDAAAMFGDREVLVAAEDLTDLPGIDRVETREVSYFHLLFERHEVIMSDVMWTESFRPAEYSVRGLRSDTRDDLLQLFPELSDMPALDAYVPVRRCLDHDEAHLLIS